MKKEKKKKSLQSATCPKHGQKPFNNLDSKETEKTKLVPAKSKLPDTKEILKILRERAIFIVSILVISVWLATLRQTEGHSVTVSCLLGPGLQNSLPVYFHPAQHRLLADLQWHPPVRVSWEQRKTYLDKYIQRRSHSNV